MDSAASSRFCEAAEQSRNQALEDLIVSPQTTIACLVSFSIRAKGRPSAIVSKAFRSVTIMNSQGRLSREEGAAIPARISLSIFSFSTGRSLYLRTLLRLSIVSKVWFSGSCRWFPVEEAGHEENGDQEEKTDSHKDGFIWFITDYLLNINVEGIFCKASFRCSETSFHVL